MLSRESGFGDILDQRRLTKPRQGIEVPIMRMRLLLSFALLMPLAGALGVARYRIDRKLVGEVYRGMTASEWEQVSFTRSAARTSSSLPALKC